MIRKVRELQNFFDFQITGNLSQSKTGVIKRTCYGVPDVFTAAFFQMNPSGKTKQNKSRHTGNKIFFPKPTNKQTKRQNKTKNKTYCLFAFPNSLAFYLWKE